MIHLILGGSGSGKSSYAESEAVRLRENRTLYYLATMQVYGEEGRKKVERHRNLRAGKGFLTQECPVDLADVCAQMDVGSVALLECISNLTANEMFRGEQIAAVDDVVEKIEQDVKRVAAQVKHLVIVSNNVFEDGIAYEKETMQYLEALGRINVRLARMADRVTEVVVGIPVCLSE